MEWMVLALLCLFMSSSTMFAALAKKSKGSRQGKLFSLFQVIRFPNEACNGTGNAVGTCYTDQECQTRRGMAMGACANGYGVCCGFTISCGQTSSENCTIFNDNTAPDMGVCTGTICPITANICQLRLDFQTFQITAPATVADSVTSLKNGASVADPTMGTPNSAVGQCLTDLFQVTSGSANNPPGICGMNSDDHMFLDADDGCNALTFQFGGGAVNRQFSIKITQYACNSPNLAPTGCTQYFVSENGQGSVQTFNFAGGLHLANQRQVMCVRQNRDTCRICWTTTVDADFDVSGSLDLGLGSKQSSLTGCGGPSATGKSPIGLDALSIPLAEAKAGDAFLRSRFCGRNSGLSATSGGTGALTICSQAAPFRLVFRSDSFESLAQINPAETNSESTNKDNGVRLIYFQDNNC